MRRIRRGRRRARRLIPRRRTRIPWVPLAILATLIVAIASAALLDGRRDREIEAGFIEHIRANQGDPVRMITAAGRRHRIIFLGDLPAGIGPKRIAADAIDALAHGPGLDALILEVGADLQDRIDAYLTTEPEEVAILLAEPRITQGNNSGASDAYLEIYRRVWRLNRTLEPGRRIRIIAADLPGWPPLSALTAQQATAQFAQRDAYMTERIESLVLAGNHNSRLLIFMSGYHGLKSGQAELQVGIGAPVPIVWLGTRLGQLHPGEVFSVVVDGEIRPNTSVTVAGYTASNLHELLRKHLSESVRSFAIGVDHHFDFLRAPIRMSTAPGIEMRIRPDGYLLRDLIDGYIYLGTMSSGEG